MAEGHVRDFIRAIVDEDLRLGHRSKIITRFPPEPNGFPHIGHAKSITLNFGLAHEYGGVCHLRFDDTNPETEDIQYVEAIREAVRWLGYDFEGKEFYASDYFEQLYQWACQLITCGLAYVDDQSEEEIRSLRGTVTEPGRPSPWRDRSKEENLELFRAMRAGAFPDGTKVLRAKIDMAHANMKMRDPLMYRIRHAHHYRQGDAWCIYPFYDWAHGQSDAIEGVTHSICTLEFTTNRVLYDWYLDALGILPRPYQYEFARLNLGYTITSKRKLMVLVKEGYVDGWDDPRMPTLAGTKRRGVTPEAVHAFCEAVGTTKVDSVNDPNLLDHHIRADLNQRAPRVLCVLDPLRVTLTNYPEGQQEWLEAPYWPRDIAREGARTVPFSRSLLIERDDFAQVPPKGFRRLSPGVCVRLRYAYVIRCDKVINDASGKPQEILCTWIPDADGVTVRSTIHWVDAHASLAAEVRLYERLFAEEHPGSEFIEELNPASRSVMPHSRIEPSVAEDPADTRYQFTRLGYFWRDPAHRDARSLVFNRIVALRDSWAHPQVEPTSHEQTQPRTQGPAGKPDALPAEALAWLNKHGLAPAENRPLVRSQEAMQFFEDACSSTDKQRLAQWMVHQLLPGADGTALAELLFGPKAFGHLVDLVVKEEASAHDARQVLTQMLRNGGDPEALLARRKEAALDDVDTIDREVVKALTAYPDKVAAYHGGKTGLLGFFVGQVMKATRGASDPKLVRTRVLSKLGQ